MAIGMFLVASLAGGLTCFLRVCRHTLTFSKYCFGNFPMGVMMPVRPSPTVRRRRLRYELRRLRNEHGLTIEQVQERSGGDIKAPSISRWENGERSVRPTDLRLLLDIYDVQGERRETLLTLSRQAKERGWWQSYGSAIPEWFQVYVGLEAEASSVRVYESVLVHGLLQTPD